MNDLIGHFGDFETFIHDANLESKVFRTWSDGQQEKMLFRIIGSVQICNRILLEIVIVDNEIPEFDVDDPIVLVWLDDIVEQGFEFHQEDQFIEDGGETDEG